MARYNAVLLGLLAALVGTLLASAVQAAPSPKAKPAVAPQPTPYAASSKLFQGGATFGKAEVDMKLYTAAGAGGSDKGSKGNGLGRKKENVKRVPDVWSYNDGRANIKSKGGLALGIQKGDSSAGPAHHGGYIGNGDLDIFKLLAGSGRGK